MRVTDGLLCKDSQQSCESLQRPLTHANQLVSTAALRCCCLFKLNLGCSAELLTHFSSSFPLIPVVALSISGLNLRSDLQVLIHGCKSVPFSSDITEIQTQKSCSWKAVFPEMWKLLLRIVFLWTPRDQMHKV